MALSWKLKLQLIAVLLLAQSGGAQASSSDEWEHLKQETRLACLAQSGLRQARVLEGPVIFSNRVLYRIGGIWPQPHMKGKAGKVYCLHPYPDGKLEIAE